MGKLVVSKKFEVESTEPLSIDDFEEGEVFTASLVSLAGSRRVDSAPVFMRVYGGLVRLDGVSCLWDFTGGVDKLRFYSVRRLHATLIVTN